MAQNHVFISGVGPVSPIGIGREDFRHALLSGRSGLGPIGAFDANGLPIRIATEVRDFDPRKHTRARKQLKVMARDAQLGVAASWLAAEDAHLEKGALDPQRIGVIFGADRICGAIADSEGPYRASMVDGEFHFERWPVEGFAATFPLSFLKVLPNMTGSHISIAHDARGPNNTIHHSEVSATLALIEGINVIHRGAADVIITGGAGSQMTPYDWVRHCISGRLSQCDDGTPRPFDKRRDGEVRGEGALALVIEGESTAAARGAKPLAEVLGYGSAFCPPDKGCLEEAIARALGMALARAELKPADVAYVVAHGWSTPQDDVTEARAIGEVLAGVPVTAPSSYFGNVGAGLGVMGLAAALVLLEEELAPPTLNYTTPDPECPVKVIHGEPADVGGRAFAVVNWLPTGQAVALMVGKVS